MAVLLKERWSQWIWKQNMLALSSFGETQATKPKHSSLRDVHSVQFSLRINLGDQYVKSLICKLGFEYYFAGTFIRQKQAK